jgi:hypothetical protein
MSFGSEPEVGQAHTPSFCATGRGCSPGGRDDTQRPSHRRLGRGCTKTER